MPDVANFTIAPPLRCYGQRRDRPGRACGELAAWQRRSPHSLECTFFCDHCKQPGDEPIAPDAPFRRITFTLDLILAATSLIPGTARAEALSQVEEVARRVGALLNLHTVSDVVGRPAGQAAAHVETRNRGRAG